MREPDTVDFVKQIVASYGYTDPDVLALRSQRDHNGTQYLQYDYGLVSYMDTMSFFGAGRRQGREGGRVPVAGLRDIECKEESGPCGETGLVPGKATRPLACRSQLHAIRRDPCS